MRIYCRPYKEEKACWNPKALVNMYSLKFLKIESDFYTRQHLPNSLRVLCWRDYPSNSLPSTFQLDELVMLCLPEGVFQQFCIGKKVIVLLSILTTLHLNLNNWTLGSSLT